MPSLRDICKTAGVALNGLVTHNGQPVDGGLLLWAISGNESTFGRRREFVKHEAGYLPDGRYYRRSPTLRQAYMKYGVLASSSFGSFQIMHATACELGFNAHPIELQDDEVCAHYAIKLIRERIIKSGATTLRDVLDAYNSGSWKDTVVPGKYIEDGLHFYEQGWGQ